MIYVEWADIKSDVDSKGIKVQWKRFNSTYHILLFDGPFESSAKIHLTTPRNADQIDFEDNGYKADGNDRIYPTTESIDGKYRRYCSSTLADPVSGVRAKVASDGTLQTAATVGSVSFNDLLSQDLLADTWFEILTFGAATDVVKIQITDDSVDVSVTLTGATDPITARDVIVTGLNADGTFKTLYEAIAVKDNPIVHISSLKISEAGEHLDVSDFQVSVTSGTTTVDLPSGNDVIKSRMKKSSGSRLGDDRRFAAANIYGDVNAEISARRVSDYFSKKGEDSGASTDMAINGSSTPVDFKVDAISGSNLVITEIRMSIEDGNVVFSKFMDITALTNGLKLEIKTNGVVASFSPLFKTTNDIVLLFNSGGLDTFIHLNKRFIGVFKPDNPFLLVDGSDDYILMKVQDNLAGLVSMEYSVKGYKS